MVDNTNLQFGSIFNNYPFPVMLVNDQSEIAYINFPLIDLTGYSKRELLGKSWVQVLIEPSLRENIRELFDGYTHEKMPTQNFITPIKIKNGKSITIKWNIAQSNNEDNPRVNFICIGENITDQMNNEASLKRQLTELEILHGITLSATKSHSLDELLDDATKLLTSVFDLNNYGIYLLDKEGRSLCMHDSYQGISHKKTEDRLIPSTEGILGHVFSTQKPYLCADVSKDTFYVNFDDKTQSEVAVPIQLHNKAIGVINAESSKPNYFSQDDITLLTTFSSTLSTAIDKIQLFESTQQQTKEISLLYEIAIATSSILESEKLIATVYDRIKTILPMDTFVIVKTTKQNDEYYVVSAIENDEKLTDWEGAQFPVDQGGMVGWIIKHQRPLLIKDLQKEKPPTKPIHGDKPSRSWLGIPLTIRGKTIGAMSIQSFTPNIFDEKHLHLLESLGSQIAITMENARLLEQTQSQLERLSALHDIDLVINSSLDLRVTLNILLDQVVEKLNVDAAAVLLLNPQTQLLNYAAGRGFRTRTIESYHLRLGEGISGQATMERHLVQALNLFEADDNMAYLPLLQEEGFLSFYSVPLIAKGQVKGVLDIFNRSLITPDQEWIYFLETLAGQAAIAIDNTTLLEDLQRSNIELTLAYDTTLEGWTRALDMRDQETEGHTQRVVEMTVRMAQLLGVAEKDLIHIRRGALLHDIGKMGIPDSILLKPGPLNPKEWEIMRKHPVFAYNLINPITHLRPALDIPYCHHEWWNGSGYPRQLRREEIPLSARIFSVIDVWDALTSDRPYRKAWTAKKTLEYIENQKGLQFDPQIVDLFMKLIKNELFKKL
ncbi:MAG TPA: hypothetical protein DCK95_05485 [Anaerolineaceae bacterium]|nr:hypothetical protein [Anaerolineaceae bacterium]